MTLTVTDDGGKTGATTASVEVAHRLEFGGVAGHWYGSVIHDQGWHGRVYLTLEEVGAEGGEVGVLASWLVPADNVCRDPCSRRYKAKVPQTRTSSRSSWMTHCRMLRSALRRKGSTRTSHSTYSMRLPFFPTISI